jgi:hypothetical protein
MRRPLLELLAIGGVAQVDVLDRGPVGGRGRRLPRLFHDAGDRLQGVAAIAEELTDVADALDIGI